MWKNLAKDPQVKSTSLAEIKECVQFTCNLPSDQVNQLLRSGPKQYILSVREYHAKFRQGQTELSD